MSGARRILFLHHAYERSGACVMLENLLRALDRTRWQPVVICPPGPGAALLRDTGAEVHAAERPVHMIPHVSGFSRRAWSPTFLRESFAQWKDRAHWARVIRAHDAALVHLCSLTLAPMAASAWQAGVPAVCLVQETFAPGLVGVRTRWLKRVLSAQMAGVWFISEFDRDAARCAAPIVEVIPNWTRLEGRCAARGAARIALGIAPDAEVVLFMGGLLRQKGTLGLLRAMARLARPKCLLLVAGERVDAAPLAERAEVKLRLARLHATGRVRLLGEVRDVAPCYAAADLVVFAPRAPHQGRPILEAAAMGRPVVVAAFDCVREFVTHGDNGLLVRPNDPCALADAIGRLLDRPDAARRMGAANRARAREKHDAARNGARVNAFYERVLAGR